MAKKKKLLYNEMKAIKTKLYSRCNMFLDERLNSIMEILNKEKKVKVNDVSGRTNFYSAEMMTIKKEEYGDSSFFFLNFYFSLN